MRARRRRYDMRRGRQLFLGAVFVLVLLGAFWSPTLGAARRVTAAPAGGGDAPRVQRGRDLVDEGRALFVGDFTLAQGLGPLFNAVSCASCHNAPSIGGMGTEGLGVVVRVGRTTDGKFDPLEDQGGPLARVHSVAELGVPCSLRPGVPAEATITSVRNAPALFGLGVVDAIPDEVIAAGAVARGDGVHGRVHLVQDGAGRERVGRFGWKADIATLEQFVGHAFRNEHGITNPLAPDDLLPLGALPGANEVTALCGGTAATLEDDGTKVAAVTSFVAALPALRPREGEAPELVHRGALVFGATGCIACHTASLGSNAGAARLYSDLLLHDMGPALDDGVPQEQAGGRDWRTTPLWGLGSRTRYLHDGRARSIRAAILAHGGEAAVAGQRFRDLSAESRDALMAFLEAL